MTGGARVRFWIESIVGGAAGFLALLTVFWRDWLEAGFGWDPDHHNGSAEWLIVIGLAAVALVLGGLARWERRRAVAQPARLAGPGVVS